MKDSIVMVPLNFNASKEQDYSLNGIFPDVSQDENALSIFRIQDEFMNGGEITDTPAGALVLAEKVGAITELKGSKYGYVLELNGGFVFADAAIKNKEVLLQGRNEAISLEVQNLNVSEVRAMYQVIQRSY